MIWQCLWRCLHEPLDLYKISGRKITRHLVYFTIKKILLVSINEEKKCLLIMKVVYFIEDRLDCDMIHNFWNNSLLLLKDQTDKHIWDEWFSNFFSQFICFLLKQNKKKSFNSVNHQLWYISECYCVLLNLNILIIYFIGTWI